MSTRAKKYRAKHTATRLRAVWRRLAALRRQSRRAVTLGLATAFLAMAPAATVLAQTGQTAMAPSGGMLGRAVNGFRDLNQNGPGIFYYGINAADRGLGYRGSYMTAGGFIPVVEDDLGGYWSADLRGHLSEYGGFFSNVGAVRKQFIGGTLLGVGVFWDYDGDMNQYDDTVITDASGDFVFAGGQTYNQVGIAGEWLTDFGNLRSNGYIPVGPTGDIVGPFVGNSILCVNGVNAALGGADLEVGAYIPGLSDWAGMINVGGYAYGNTRYEFPGGGHGGGPQGAVPWFGGVYTRLDMTFVENWDFSLQANNDSYFDWTGFARLTYRMGGSRRRNVPDQVEQPMMRNEHIVRAHQAPVVALNPNNLDAAGNPLPWQMFHVDNSAAPGGNGTANAPFQTLTQAETAAIAEWDIVYVYVGDSLTTPYSTPIAGYSFAAANQYFLGEGTSITIPTVECGDLSLNASNNPDLYPIITNPVGAAINVDQPGTRVDHIEIVNSNIGISDGVAGFSAPGVAIITDVIIRGTNGPFERGVEIAQSDGQFRFDNVRLSDLGNDGFVVSAADGDVVITNSTLTDVDGIGIAASGAAATISVASTTLTRIDGTAIEASGDDAVITVSATTITNTLGADGDAVVASGDRARVDLDTITITTMTGQGIVASGTDSVVTATNSTITGTGSPAVLVEGTGATVYLDNTDIADVSGTGIVVNAPDAVVQMTNGSTLSDTTLNGIEILDDDAELFVLGQSIIRDIGADGIFTNGGSILVQDSNIQNVVGAGIRAVGVSAAADSVVAVQGSSITNASGGGIITRNSNLRVERLDASDPLSRITNINNTGLYGIQASADSIGPPNNYQVLVSDTTIGVVSLGISIEASADVLNPPAGLVPPGIVPTINFTALDNTITATDGPGISVNAVFDGSIGFPGRPLSRVNALIEGNQVEGGLDTDILLATGGDTTLWAIPGGGLAVTPAIYRPITVAAANEVTLENLNFNAVVDILQEPESVNFAAGTVVPPPPPPPPIPPAP